MIKLLKKYPYDNSYDYVKLFDSKEKQETYFDNFDKIIITEDDYGYIKEGESFIVEMNYDDLVAQNVNYLIFNNGYKTIYAFIIRKEYIDEDNTRLIYEIDVLNTFCFDFNFKNSFITRLHCDIDEIADYDEQIEMGEHIIESDITAIKKQYDNFLMFGGIKKPVVSVDVNGNVRGQGDVQVVEGLVNVVIDNIEYPIHMALAEDSYEKAKYEKIQPSEDGTTMEPTGDGILPNITNTIGTFMIPTYGRITATYPTYPSGGAHSGIDIANAGGTPIYAPKSGKIEVRNSGNISYGLHVRLTHDDGSLTILAHLSKVSVSTGDYVQTGQNIGLMGTTGNSSGNHLHFEIRTAGGSAINPMPGFSVGTTIPEPTEEV